LEIPDCVKTKNPLSLVFMFYILEQNTPVACTSGPEWQEWIEQAGDRRIVGQDDAGDFLVSTVFQGVDPVLPDSPTPLLFETLIYDRNGQVAGNRGLYPTWAMAEVGHRRAVLRLRNTERGRRPMSDQTRELPGERDDLGRFIKGSAARRGVRRPKARKRTGQPPSGF
jgi:hypothetical protein